MQLYELYKKEIPTEQWEREEFAINLMKYEVSLQQYEDAFVLENITMYIRILYGPLKMKRALRVNPQKINYLFGKCSILLTVPLIKVIINGFKIYKQFTWWDKYVLTC